MLEKETLYFIAICVGFILVTGAVCYLLFAFDDAESPLNKELAERERRKDESI